MKVKYDAILGQTRESDIIPGEGNVVLEAGENVTLGLNAVTGATIISATGGGGMGQTYTINGQAADVTGNFVITPEGLGAAALLHTHAEADIPGLPEALAGKALLTHTHELVSGVTVGGQTISGAVTLAAGNNVTLEVAGNAVNLHVDPVAAGKAASVANLATADGGTVKTFIGTEAAWTAFTKETGVKYLVYIVGA